MKEIKKKNWYVFYTSPRAEKKVNEYLLSLGYESFLPLKSEFKIWRNRQRKLIKSPLFPSYIFVLATRNDIFDINRIYGICYCVTCAGVPAVISGNDIMSLKIMQEMDVEILRNNEFSSGDKIRIIDGPLCGYEGILIEIKGTLKVNISSPSSIKFPRPRPIAGKAVLMGDESKDAIYSSATQKLSAPVEYSTSIEMKPRCLLQLTTKFKTFILNVPYVAVAKYGDREIKVRGTWRGYSVADPELNKPINEPHYFDLETGEELNYSLSFDPERKIYVTK